MAQQNEGLEELQRRKASAVLEKETLDAELGVSESKKKLAESLAGPNPQVAAARSSKEIAEAKKAQSDAELAAFKARVGDMPSSGIAGSVELTDKAGSMETALLAAIALRTAATRIAEQVAAALPPASAPARIVVMPAGELPSFQAATGFFSQKAVLQRAFIDAMRAAQSASRAAEKPAAALRTEAVPLAAAGVALDAAAKLLGFFRSDFKVGGTELAADNALLAETAGGELRAKYPRDGTQILLRLAFNPAAVANVGANLLPELDALSAQRKAAADSLATLEGSIARLEAAKAAAAAETDKKTQDDLLRPARAAAARVTATIAAYDALVDKLLSPDDQVLAMIRELDAWKSLQDPGAYLLVVKVNKAGGSHYVEKNLWTTFGAMPYKVMGGVIASYSLFEGASGDLVAAGIVPIHGGFFSAKKVADAID